MIHRWILTTALAAALCSAPFTVHAEEELFDTRAAEKHIEQGVAHLKAKKVDAAISELEAAAEISPEAEVFYYLGYAYYLKGRAGSAESREQSRMNFEQAFELDPNFTPTRFKPAMAAPAGAAPASEPAGSPAEQKH